MKLTRLKLALYSAGFASFLLVGCATTDKSGDKALSESEVALMIEKAKAEERERIQQQLAKQQEKSALFNQIKARQIEKQALLDTRDTIRIKPSSNAAVFYRNQDGLSYYRCAAPAQKPMADSAGKWYYHKDTTELSATLCAQSRSKALIKKVQQKLFDMGYLFSANLSQPQLVDGVWGEASLEALKEYQKYHGLLYGQLTIESLEHMGLFPASNESFALLGVSEIAPPTELEKQLQLKAQRLKEKQQAQEQAEQDRREAERKLMIAEAASSQSADTPNLPMVTNFVVDNRDSVFYRNVDGVDYYRCAANAFVADLKAGKWDYSAAQKQLSATLCKASRNKKVISDLQQRLYQLGYLQEVAESRQLTKEQVVDGIWGDTTLEALKAYQVDNGLVFGQLTIQSLENLGVFEAPSERIEPTSLLANLARNTLGNIEQNQVAEEQSTAGNGQIEVLAEESAGNESVNGAPTDSAAETAEINDSAIGIENEQSTAEENINDTERLMPNDTVPWPAVTNFVVDNRKRAMYRKVGGVDYYRCAANALVPQYKDGHWDYSREEKQLSATLCKSSRDLATMTDLQYRLYEQGYLKTVAEEKGLTKAEVVDGIWGSSTLQALKQYQADNGLVFGQLTIQSLEHIGVFAADIGRTRQHEQNLAQTESVVATELQSEQSDISEEIDNSEMLVSNNHAIAPEESGEIDVAANHVNEPSVAKPIKVDNQQPTAVLMRLQRVQGDNFDFISGVPSSSKPVLAGYIKGAQIWRCGARAQIPMLENGQPLYSEDQKQMRATLCKMSRSRAMIKPLQQALLNKGYLKPLPPLDYVVVDGIWGINTLNALKEFQKDNGLAYGQLTLQSYIELGVLDLLDEQ
ncbi:peptidoglycan-binding domain-containing protein [Thiomicrorhabdus sediminis]|uniref:Peptidoglycan binding-like domain-containing protein n=1 Tax=Thiomicrorhabdus sediminis TaxID=2580412 RepID=A0A4P9K5K3_9GAMM|nr:peptidoglycan-binding domain-containing protein [Thiomicrorhabdus sediminis]QCU90262.1 hypothetical protein FE785_06280 [Thiomicrorhabdus sediminis]